MTVQRLSKKFSPVIEQALEENHGDDEVWWEIGLAPTEMGLVPAVLIQMPSPVIGQALGAQIAFGKGFQTTEDEIAKTVADALESMRQNRSAMLAGVPQTPEAMGMPQPG